MPMSEDVRRLVGRNVQQLRIKAGLSQAALAERMGVDRAYVSGLELGQRNPTVITLWHVGKALGVKLRRFFEETTPRSRGGSYSHGPKTSGGKPGMCPNGPAALEGKRNPAAKHS